MPEPPAGMDSLSSSTRELHKKPRSLDWPPTDGCASRLSPSVAQAEPVTASRPRSAEVREPLATHAMEEFLVVRMRQYDQQRRRGRFS